ncbi:DUF268 domain-containing protein [Desulfatirhabdium butyrativorans]|uniref:DUF268 domain-containing protein n=1 Tax=Desulfatirhabdium butyrativorans TaxID=340467 RepID=UPI0006889661|nr:DUF268 domain-containing protein [Desulfatirhabdium butyrativorans]
MRTFLLYINALFPFLYPMKHLISGKVFFGFYRYLIDLIKYKNIDSSVHSEFPLRMKNTFPCLIDRYENAGNHERHYFWQDIWGARKVYQSGVKCHYDIGSRLDGFIAHCLPFCEIVMLDIRPLPIQVENLKFLQTNCMDMNQIPSDSIASLSSLHAIEHFGLGRYGDAVDPLGHLKAIKEMKRVVCVGGGVYIGVPIGRQRLEFNGHRIFDPVEIVRLFNGFDLIEFSVIDDNDLFYENVDMQQYRSLSYGCGLFHFRKL